MSPITVTLSAVLILAPPPVPDEPGLHTLIADIDSGQWGEWTTEPMPEPEPAEVADAR
jgi:hypothetical protein